MTTFVLSPMDQPVHDPIALAVIDGLRAVQKTLPAALFYDASRTSEANV